MSTRTVPGAGAQFQPTFDAEFGVESIQVLNGGSGYASTDPPKISITGTTDPIQEGVFFPVIVGGSIVRIAVLERGSGYFPIPVELATRVGIATTSYVESSIVINKGDHVAVASTESSIIMHVGDAPGSSIFENGYNVALSTSIIGVAATVVPDGSFNQNAFYGLFDPFPSYTTSGLGTGSEFSVFFVYNSSTGVAISTSLILRKGGRGYQVGDTVGISGTYMGGQTPVNDLTFVVSDVTNTRLASEAGNTYTNIPSTTITGNGSGATFEVTRDALGDVDEIRVINGGVGYALTDVVGMSGTFIGGVTPADDLRVSPTVLGTNKLPSTLYVEKVDNNSFQVSGLSTAPALNLTSFGSGENNLQYDEPNASALISIDNIIQAPIYKRDITPTLNHTIGITTDIIYLSGIGSITSIDIIQINQELFKINTIGLTSESAIGVTRGYIGSKVGYHTVGAAVTVLRGDYNITEGNVNFTTPPYGKTGFAGIQTHSTFGGRVFSRRFDPGAKNDINLIFDDLSTKFVSASSTEFFLSNYGEDVVGIFTDTNTVLGGNIDINNNPLVLINNIPQISGTDFTIENAGQNRLRFLSGVPNAGRIVRTGISTGFGYLPLVGAGATAIIGAGGTISSIDIRGFGQGYRVPPVIEVYSSHGSSGILTASIGAGGTITDIHIANPGTGYSVTEPPLIYIDKPPMYSGLDLDYIDGSTGEGTGAKVSVVVGNAGDIIGFNLDELGSYYKTNDVLKVVGIITDSQVGAGFSEFRVTVEEVATDKFSGIYPGQFVQFDDISRFFNGFKKKFTLSVTSGGKTEVLSLKVDPSSDLEMENNLFVYINDVLQIPQQSYSFNGSRITFTEPPKPNSKCTILFYRGSDLDVTQVDPPRTIKEGDSIQIGDNILDPTDRPQFERIVKRIVSTDALDTFTYDSIGINTDPTKERPLNWVKQTTDKIINGVFYSKARPDLNSRVTPNTKIIKNVGKSDDHFYVNNAFPLFSDVDGLSENLRDVKIVDVAETNAAITTAVVSAAGTVSSIVVSYGGTGYHRLENPNVAISSAIIRMKDPIFNWVGSNNGISTETTINSLAIGKPIVAVGDSGFVGVSTNGISWSTSTLGVGTAVYNEIDFNSVGIAGTNVCLTVGEFARVVRFNQSPAGISNSINIKLLKEIVVVGLPDPLIEFSQYTNTFNSIVYNDFRDTWVAVGAGPGVFQGVGIGTTSFFEKASRVFNDLNAVSHNKARFVAVGDGGVIIHSEDGNFWDLIQQLPTTRNLKDVTWTGQQFVVVGDNGTIFTSPHGGLNWTKVVPNIGDHLVKIKYEYGVYVATNSAGQLLFSLDLSYWTYRGTNQTNTINDLGFIPAPPPAHLRTERPISEEGRYVLVGASGTSMYAEPIYNRATGVSTVVNESVSSVDVVNPGFGYSMSNPPAVLVESDAAVNEQIYSIKAKGDFGHIKYVGVGNSFIDFILQSEKYDNATLGIGYSSLDSYGVTYSEIEVGDRFVITESNSTVSHALTGITTSLGGVSNYPASKVGTAVSFIDGVYQAERVDATPSTGIVTVRCMFAYAPNNGPIQVSTLANENGLYGRYSWGKIYDYQNRIRFGPEDFIVNTDNGLVGLSTAPDVYRTRGLS